MNEVIILLRLEASLYLIIIAGIILRRKGFLDETCETVMTKITLYLVLPCSIVKSFLVEFDMVILKQFTVVLAVALAASVLQVLTGRLMFAFLPPERRKIMEYGMINANSAFLGMPLIEGVYGAAGLSQAAIYMIPNRIFIWTVGLSLFTAQGGGGKALLKKCLLHPCMVSLYIGVFLMVTQFPVPSVAEEALKLMSGCLTSLSMLLIGSILSKASLKKMFGRESIFFCFVRLAVLPGIVFGICFLLKAGTLITGVCVMMSSMPAASITAMLAQQYGADAETAGIVVTLSTALSTLTVPIWIFAVQSLQI